MSLTSHLKSKDSPVRKFLRDQFLNTRTLLKAARKQVREADTILPDAGPSYRWDLIGGALDYRIRYYFDVTPYDKLKAYKGARYLTDDQSVASSVQLGFTWTGQLDEAVTIFDRRTGKKVYTYFPDSNGGFSESEIGDSLLLEALDLGSRVVSGEIDESDDSAIPLKSEYVDFFNSLITLTAGNYPVAKRLSGAEEDELNRHCIVLALMEEVVRTNDGRLLRGEFSDADFLIDLVESNWIDDLRELSWTFYDSCDHLLALPHVLNPTFDGSKDVGGADADLIVDGMLIEIKTTKKPEIKPEWIWQLLGYMLLDYSDCHRIGSIGLYMARQGILFEWDLEETIRALCPGNPSGIGELRSKFKELTHSLSRTVDSRFPQP